MGYLIGALGAFAMSTGMHHAGISPSNAILIALGVTMIAFGVALLVRNLP